MNFYLLAKKIHRLLILFITVLGLLMVSTGLMMRYPILFDVLQINPELARQAHRNLSTYFTIVFLLMLATGLTMYFVLKFKKSPQSKTPQEI